MTKKELEIRRAKITRELQSTNYPRKYTLTAAQIKLRALGVCAHGNHQA